MSTIEEEEPTVGLDVSPTGKPMNCNSWGTYESPGTSETAALCSGGTVDGTLWAACPSREECRMERNRRMLADARNRTDRTQLPVVQQSAVRFVGGQGPRPMTTTTLPTARPIGGPAQVVKPESDNLHLSTPRILSPTRAGMHSPTFLPKRSEHWLLRLLKNMFQGTLNALGWHVHDYTQNVDLFPHPDEKKED